MCKKIRIFFIKYSRKVRKRGLKKSPFICICQKKTVPLQRISKFNDMGTLINTKEPKTEKGNRMYEFKRVQSDELEKYRIPVYGYMA